MVLEKAHSNDHEILTEITKKSKAYWEYSQEQMEIWSESLTITELYIAKNTVFKLIVDNKIVGYYSFFCTQDKMVKLDNLFILPDYIGKGFGRTLMEHFLTSLKNSGFEKVILDSEPNSELFYSKFGFITIGQLETSIENRSLPIMELKIAE